MDQIADMLTRIRNAQSAGALGVEMPSSNFKLSLARFLNKHGYIEEVSVFSEGSKKYLRLKLKYLDRKPAIKGIKTISRQGQRIYVKKDGIPFVKDGHGVAVISTPQGILSDEEARKNKLGGEVICFVW